MGSIVASELVTFCISLVFNLHADLPAYLVSGIVPLLLAGIGSYFQLKRLEQVREAYRELSRVASTDYLTGCLNRRAFTTAAGAAAKIGRPGALLVIDVDGFKSINDVFGHDRGDDVLRRIVTIINDSTGASDLVGRLGGEEFGVYLRDAGDRQATSIAETIREAVAGLALSPPDAPHTLSVSIGVATVAAPVGLSELLHLAESQLLAAKSNGRNRIAVTAAAASGVERSAA